METPPLDLDAQRQALADLIATQEAFLEQKDFKQLTESINEDVEGCIQRITQAPPETIGQFFAHWVDIGRLAGLRELTQRPKDALQELKNKLKGLDNEHR